jgi:hypothetical protein
MPFRRSTSACLAKKRREHKYDLTLSYTAVRKHTQLYPKLIISNHCWPSCATSGSSMPRHASAQSVFHTVTLWRTCHLPKKATCGVLHCHTPREQPVAASEMHNTTYLCVCVCVCVRAEPARPQKISLLTSKTIYNAVIIIIMLPIKP